MYTVLTIDKTAEGIMRTHYSAHDTMAHAMDQAVNDALWAFGINLVVTVQGSRKTGFTVNVCEEGMESVRYVSVRADEWSHDELATVKDMLESGVYDAFPVKTMVEA